MPEPAGGGMALRRGNGQPVRDMSSASSKRLPFIVRAPNPATAEAIEELEEGKGKRFESAEDLFRDLGIGRQNSGE